MDQGQRSTDSQAEHEGGCTWSPQLRVHLHHSLQQHRTSLLFLRSCGERVGARGTENRHHLQNIGCVRSTRWPMERERSIDNGSAAPEQLSIARVVFETQHVPVV